MRFFHFAFLLLVLSTFPAYPTTGQSEFNESETYFYLKKGQLYVYSEGGRNKLTGRMILSNGMQVFSNGTYIRVNEARRNLQEGHYLDVNGKVYRTLAALQAQMEVHRMALRSECFRLTNGEVIHHKNGAPVKITERVLLNHGVTLYPDGLYIDPSGKKYKLREGYCMDHGARTYKSLQEFHLEVEKRNRLGKN